MFESWVINVTEICIKQTEIIQQPEGWQVGMVGGWWFESYSSCWFIIYTSVIFMEMTNKPDSYK